MRDKINGIIRELIKDPDRLELVDEVDNLLKTSEIENTELRNSYDASLQSIEQYKEKNHKLLETNNRLFLKQSTMEERTELKENSEQLSFDDAINELIGGKNE